MRDQSLAALLARAAIRHRCAEFAKTLPTMNAAARRALEDAAAEAPLDPNDIASANAVLAWIEAAGWRILTSPAAEESSLADEEVLAMAEDLAHKLAAQRGFTIGGPAHSNPNPQVQVWWEATKVAFEVLRATDLDDTLANLGIER